MKTKLITLALVTLFASGLSTGVLAHEDTSEAGSWHWLDHVGKLPSTPESLQAERIAQKNWDRDVGNHVEGVGGHAMHEAGKMKSASPEQMAQKRENEKTLDRGAGNHEEGVGGHALYEAARGR